MIQVLLAASAAILWATIASAQDGDAAPAPAPAVVAEPAQMRVLGETARFNGRLDAAATVQIVARVSGTLLEQSFEAGDIVEAGQVLYRIEPDIYEADTRQAEGAVRSAEAQRDLAVVDRDRQQELFERDAAPQAALDTAEGALGRAEGELIKAQAALDAARTNLSYTEIVAPFTGRIGVSNVDVGALIGPDVGALVTLVALDPIHAEFPLPTVYFRILVEELQAGTETPDAATVLQLANGSYYPEPGEIDFVDSEVNALTDSVQVRARFPNPDGVLLHGELVVVEVRATAPAEVLAIPQQAVQRDIQGSFALVVGEGETVEQRRIVVARTAEGYAAIETGLDVGDRVITEGINKVQPGMVVDAAPAGDG